MKRLYITVGIPGSGKTTHLKELGLYDRGYVLNPDSIRPMMSALSDGRYSEKEHRINPMYSESSARDMTSKRTFDLVEKLIVERTKMGITTILDSTMMNPKTMNTFVHLCNKHNINLYFVKYDIIIEEAKLRNSKRTGVNRVPDDVIELMYSRSSKVNEVMEKSKATVITKDELEDSFKAYKLVFEKDKDVLLVGDIHSNINELRYIINQVKEDDYMVFLGDYIDRGPNPYEVLNKLIELSKTHPNVFFLEGNHDIGILQIGEYLSKGNIDEGKLTIGNTGVRKSALGTLRSIIASIRENNMTKDEVKEYAKKLRIFHRRLRKSLYFEYNGENYLCTHAGLDGEFANENNLALMTDHVMIRGIDSYNYDIDTLYRDNAERFELATQIHGHQNKYDAENYLQKSKSINLNVLDEEIGVRYAKLSKGTYNAELVSIEIDDSEKVERFKNLAYANKDIDVKHDIGYKNISSFNFTRDVFYTSNWYKDVMIARGLFINTNTNEIVARGFDKFFNLDENVHSERKTLLKKLQSPLHVSVKENGYLGLVGYDSESDQIMVFSKTTGKGDYAESFKDTFEKLLIDEIGLKNLLKEKNASLMFEVVDYSWDKHPIIPDIEKPTIIYLGAVERVVKDSKYLELDIEKFFDKSGKDYLFKTVESKTVDIEKKDLAEYLANLEEKADNIDFEGFVVRDEDGTMFKIKGAYYSLIKYSINIMSGNREYHNIFKSINKLGVLKKNSIKKYIDTVLPLFIEDENGSRVLPDKNRLRLNQIVKEYLENNSSEKDYLSKWEN